MRKRDDPDAEWLAIDIERLERGRQQPEWQLAWREAAAVDAQEAAAARPRRWHFLATVPGAAAVAMAAALAYGAWAPPEAVVAVVAATTVTAIALAVPAVAAMSMGYRYGVLPLLAAVASAGAAAIHFAVAPMHIREYLPFGLLFVMTGVLQLVWALAVLILWPRPLVFVVGVVLSLAVVAVWVLTRTVGAPIGPDTGRAEAVGAADTICSALELGVAAVSVLLLVDTRRRAVASSSTVVAALTLAVLALTVVALLSAAGAASGVIPPIA
jgi:hypothetical protein